LAARSIGSVTATKEHKDVSHKGTETTEILISSQQGNEANEEGNKTNHKVVESYSAANHSKGTQSFNDA
jgi:hypothetical protein